MRKALCLLAAIFLGGCTTLHVAIASRTTATSGVTTVVARAGHPSGHVSINLGGKVFSGRWVYVAGGGTVSFATVAAFSGTSSATGTATALGIPMSGNGSMALSAPDGSRLSCIFNYSSWTKTGVGGCMDNKGQVYSLQIYQ